MKCPTTLIEQSLFLGSSTDFVQGAGGNLSVKLDSVMWIKASGTRLKDAGTKQIFLPMDLSSTQKEVLSSENLSNCCIPTNSTYGLRPSIETAIHSLLPHKYVAHVHSLGSISKAITSSAAVQLEELDIDAKKVFIPYSKPGIPLANAIMEQIRSLKIDSSTNLIILLGNHGLIVASEKINVATELIVSLENKWNSQRSIFGTVETQAESLAMIFPPKTLNSEQAAILTGGPLTPDEVVFLGPIPFTYLSKRNASSNVFIDEDGSVWINPELSKDALEIVVSFVNIARLTMPKCIPVYLTSIQVDELLNWDAEKWRKAQER